jgi:hypothetical protein
MGILPVHKKLIENGASKEEMEETASAFVPTAQL